MSPSSSRLAIHGLAIVCILIGATWRVWALNAYPGLDPDEVEGVLAWFRDPPILWYVYPSGRPHLNPLAPLLHWPFEAVLPPAAATVRLPAVLLGLAAIPATWLLCRVPFGRQAAASATVLVAAAPFLVAYSRQAWDLAWLPAGSAILLGVAFQRRWMATALTITVLVLIHPTAMCLLPVAALPALRDAWVWMQRMRHPALWRASLVVLAVSAWGAVYTGLAVVSQSAAPGSLWTFLAMAGHGATGALAYAEYVGAPLPVAPVWRTLGVGSALLAAAVLVWRRGDWNQRLLVAAVALGLVGQYLSLGSEELVTPLRARYFLWAVVPFCLAVAVVAQLATRTLRTPGIGVLLCCVVATAWLWTFHQRYLQAFAATGGRSSSLDYRSAGVQPKQQVLDIIRQQVAWPGQPVTLFVGEPRLHLALLYLASGDPNLEIVNLGAALYPHQTEGSTRLAHEAPAQSQTFFVDYDWNHLDGEVREIHALAARGVDGTVAPWKPSPLAHITTADGRALLRVWRLSVQ